MFRFLLSLGADPEAENECGEKPADLIDPDCKELVEMFGAGADWTCSMSGALNQLDLLLHLMMME